MPVSVQQEIKQKSQRVISCSFLKGGLFTFFTLCTFNHFINERLRSIGTMKVSLYPSGSNTGLRVHSMADPQDRYLAPCSRACFAKASISPLKCSNILNSRIYQSLGLSQLFAIAWTCKQQVRVFDPSQMDKRWLPAWTRHRENMLEA